MVSAFPMVDLFFASMREKRKGRKIKDRNRMNGNHLNFLKVHIFMNNVCLSIRCSSYGLILDIDLLISKYRMIC